MNSRRALTALAMLVAALSATPGMAVAQEAGRPVIEGTVWVANEYGHSVSAIDAATEQRATRPSRASTVPTTSRSRRTARACGWSVATPRPR